MKKLIPAALVLAALSNFGCGSSNDSVSGPIQSPSPTPTAINPIGRLEFYVLAANQNGGGINAFHVNSQTGALTQTPGSPAAAGGSFNNVVYDAVHRTAYAVDTGTGAVQGFHVDGPTGTLTGLFGTAPTSNARGGVQLDNEANFLYCIGDNSIDAFRIDPTVGTLTRASGFPLQVPGLIDGEVGTFAPNGFLYVADAGTEQLLTFRQDPNTGALTQINSIPSGGTDPHSVDIDPTGNFLYVAEGDGTLEGFRLNSDGSLNRLSGFPVNYAAKPALTYQIAFQDANLYVGDLIGGTLNAFSVSSGGQLSQLPNYPAQGAGGGGVDSFRVPLTPYIYVTNRNNGTLNSFAVDAQGNRTAVPGTPVRTGGSTTGVTAIIAEF